MIHTHTIYLSGQTILDSLSPAQLGELELSGWFKDVREGVILDRVSSIAQVTVVKEKHGSKVRQAPLPPCRVSFW